MYLNTFQVFGPRSDVHKNLFDATNLGPFGEIGANFSLQLSSRTRFDKINKKKVIAENKC